jgi:heme A synthase
MKRIVAGLAVLFVLVLLVWLWRSRRSVETYEMPRPSNCADVAITLDAKCSTTNPAFPNDGPYADATHKYCCK